MKTQEKVLRIWQRLSKRERRIMRTRSRHGACAVLRCRCKVIVGLVQGKSPTKLSSGGLCSESQVYRVAQRFVEQGPAGMADQREDNGDRQNQRDLRMGIADRRRLFAARLWLLADHLDARTAGARVGRAYRHHGQRDHDLSAAQATSRAIGSAQADRGLSLAQGPSDAAFAADSASGSRNLPRGEVAVYVDEVDIHLNPKIGPDWMLCGQQKIGSHAGQERETLLGRSPGRPHGPTDMGRRRTQDQRLVHPLIVATAEGISAGQVHSCRAGQLQDPRQPAHAAGFGVGRQSDSAALPAAVLPRSQPHRADVERSARQRHSQPPLPEHERTDDRGVRLPPLPESTRTTRVSPHQGRLNERLPESRKAI